MWARNFRLQVPPSHFLETERNLRRMETLRERRKVFQPLDHFLNLRHKSTKHNQADKIEEDKIEHRVLRIGKVINCSVFLH